MIANKMTRAMFPKVPIFPTPNEENGFIWENEAVIGSAKLFNLFYKTTLSATSLFFLDSKINQCAVAF